MGEQEINQARDAAAAGMGMPAGLSIAAQNAYQDERNRRQGYGLPRIRMPGPPIQPEGVLWFVALPILAVWFVFADIFSWWRWWRWCGLLLGVVVAGGAFALAVQAGVRADLAAEKGITAGFAAGNDTAEMFLNVATAGGAVIIFFLIPRTLIALAAIVGLIQAWTTWVSPMLPI